MKILGISSWKEVDRGHSYVTLIENLVDNFNIKDISPIILPSLSRDDLSKYIELIDGLILSGGSDIQSFYYGKEAHIKHRGMDLKRDNFEMKLLDLAIKRKLPILCICRGMHLLNAYMGGSLYQDLKDQFASDIVHESDINSPIYHKVYNRENTFMYDLYGEETLVNSFHHQGIKNLGKGLEIISTSHDGLIEAIKVEKEDIYAIQWHPEFTNEKEDFKKIFRFFCDVVSRH